MKLKPILPSAEVIVLGKRHKGKFIVPQKVKRIPRAVRPDMAFNSYNKQLRKKKGIEEPIEKSIHNFNFSGNGMRGLQKHTKGNVISLAGNTNLRNKPKKVNDIELNAEDVQEQMQLNFDGTQIRGKRITDNEEAKAWIKKYGGVIKHTRGNNFTSGRFTGGLLRRTYEAQTKRESGDGVNVEVEDEFTDLNKQIQEEQTNSNIKVSSEGL